MPAKTPPSTPEPSAATTMPVLDSIGLTLFASGLLLAVAIFSQPMPVERVYLPGNPSAPVENLLGPLGQQLATQLLEALGLAVYVLLAAWWVLVVMLLLRRSWLRWLRRLLGWLLLVPSASLIAALIGPEQLPGPWTGPGGQIGAASRVWLEQRLALTGAWGIASTLTLLGMLHAMDGLPRAMWWASKWTVARGWMFLTWLVRLPLQLGRAVRPPRTRPQQDTVSIPPVPPLPPPGSAAATNARDTGAIPIQHHSPRPAAAAQSLTTSAAVAAVPFELPPPSLLEPAEPTAVGERDEELRQTAILLEKTCRDFGVNVTVVGIQTGPVITQYEITLEVGLRLAKVTNLADDLALNLGVPSVRIVAPIPGRTTVGIEVPNERRAVVRLRTSLEQCQGKLAKTKLPLLLGTDTEGRPLLVDLAEMPHLLIAGRTGTGKSVCMNAVILSLLMTRRPDQVRMIMIDPKMLELSEYGRIPHLMHPVVKDMKKAEAILAWAVDKMEERYEILSRARVRSIAGYNDLPYDEILRRVRPVDEAERERLPEQMASIVIFVDEMGDLMMAMKKEVEGHIIRLAQKSRAAGIHLVVATQKPTVDVITGLIKSNLPARICFQVSSRTDSMVVLDEKGADKLLGMGDMLFLQPKTGTILRAQGTYASDHEISRVVAHLDTDPLYEEELMDLRATTRDGSGGFLDALRERDPVYEQAIEVVIREQRGSVSLLQRALGIGYGRAARLIDYMAEDGIVGQYNGSQAREVMYDTEKWEAIKAGVPVD